MDSLELVFTEKITQLDDSEDDAVFFELELYLNNKKILFFTDPVAFLYPARTVRDTYHPYDRRLFVSCKGKLTSTYSDFYPFSCSCGVAGCASLWDGIYVKDRKKTIEWRVPPNSGYHFLDKRFYSFKKEDYLLQLKRLKNAIKNSPSVFLSDWETCQQLANRLAL